jgi:dethiobiotin synthase
VAELLVVTGTDTGVGKTITTAAVAARYRTAGRSVTVIKPFQTGVGPDEAGDLEVVRELVPDVRTLELARYADPLAPATAARLAGMNPPDVRALRNAILTAAEDVDLVLVEGAGGVLVPLVPGVTLLDLIGLVALGGLRAGWIVVARSGLGTLNHSALTTAALHEADQEVLGLVIGSWPSEPGLVERTNLEDLPEVTGVPIIGRLPEGAGDLSPEEFAAGAEQWIVIPG